MPGGEIPEVDVAVAVGNRQSLAVLDVGEGTYALGVRVGKSADHAAGSDIPQEDAVVRRTVGCGQRLTVRAVYGRVAGWVPRSHVRARIAERKSNPFLGDVPNPVASRIFDDH